MKPEYEITINFALDGLLIYSFYEYINNQNEGFGNLAIGMTWVCLIMMFLSSLIPVDKWGKIRSQSVIEKICHFVVGLSIIGVCFYLGWFIIGAFYLISWIHFTARKEEYHRFHKTHK